MCTTRIGVKVTVLALMIVLVSESVIQAQFRGGRRVGRRENNAVGLAGREQVQQELKVNDVQKKQIQEIVETYRNESQDLFAGLQDLGPGERREQMAELRTKREQLIHVVRHSTPNCELVSYCKKNTQFDRKCTHK